MNDALVNSTLYAFSDLDIEVAIPTKMSLIPILVFRLEYPFQLVQFYKSIKVNGYVYNVIQYSRIEVRISWLSNTEAEYNVIYQIIKFTQKV